MTNNAPADYANTDEQSAHVDWNDAESYPTMLRNLLTANAEQANDKPTIYVVQRHVTASGMSRDLSLYIVMNNEPRDITHMVAEVLGYRLNHLNYTIRVQGTGMDMHFHTVYQLGRKLYPNGNPAADRDASGYTSHDAGYMIQHRTI